MQWGMHWGSGVRVCRVDAWRHSSSRRLYLAQPSSRAHPIYVSPGKPAPITTPPYLTPLAPAGGPLLRKRTLESKHRPLPHGSRPAVAPEAHWHPHLWRSLPQCALKGLMPLSLRLLSLASPLARTHLETGVAESPVLHLNTRRFWGSSCHDCMSRRECDQSGRASPVIACARTAMACPRP